MQFPQTDPTKLPLAGGTMTGAIKAADGAAATPSVYWDTNSGFWNDTADSGIGISVSATQTGWFDATGLIFSIAGGGTSNVQVRGEGTVNNIVRRVDNSANSPNLTTQKGRGTLASPAVCALSDVLGTVTFAQYNGTSGFAGGARMRGLNLETTPSATALGGRLEIDACAIGSVTFTEIARFEVGTGLSMFGANSVIDANRLIRLRVFTVATLPTAPPDGSTAYISDSALALGFGTAVGAGGGTNHMPVYYNSGTAAWMIG